MMDYYWMLIAGLLVLFGLYVSLWWIKYVACILMVTAFLSVFALLPNVISQIIFIIVLSLSVLFGRVVWSGRHASSGIVIADETNDKVFRIFLDGRLWPIDLVEPAKLKIGDRVEIIAVLKDYILCKKL